MRSIAHTAPSGTYNRLTGTQAAPITHGPCHRNTITLGGGRRGRREKSMSTVAAQGPRAAARRVALGHAAYVRSKADLGSRMGRRGGQSTAAAATGREKGGGSTAAGSSAFHPGGGRRGPKRTANRHGGSQPRGAVATAALALKVQFQTAVSTQPPARRAAGWVGQQSA